MESQRVQEHFLRFIFPTELTWVNRQHCMVEEILLLFGLF